MNQLTPPSRPRLRWNPTVEWTAHSKTASRFSVTFSRKGATVLRLEVSAEVVGFLHEFLPDFAYGEPSLQVSPNPQVQAFIDLLIKHQLLLTETESPHHVRLNLYVDRQTMLETWCLPAERSWTIDLLIGDESRLAREFDRFSESRPHDHMVAYLKIYQDMIEAGPVRYPYEQARPTTRRPEPQCYPAWPQRLDQHRGAIYAFYADAVTSTQWHLLTTKGARLSLTWEEAKAPYQFRASPITRLTEAVPFFHWHAQVEGETGAGGVGQTAAAAEYAATCEAWERYCLSRPDLQTASTASGVEDLSQFPGIYFDYLRRLAKPMQHGPSSCLAWKLAGDQAVSLPTAWVYFNGHNSVANTSGAAFGTSLQDAISGGKAEVIERHLLMQAYLQLRKSQEFVPQATAIPAGMREFLDKPGRRVRFYDVGCLNDIYGVVCILARDVPPFVSMGCSAKANRDEAALKALYEAIVTDSQWSRRIEQYGVNRFVQMGADYLRADPAKVGFEESAWHWAALEDAESLLHERFNTGAPDRDTLCEDSFVAIDVGQNIVPRGAVVKVIHPQALPLPSCFAHARVLFELLGRDETRTIPMF